MSNRYFLADVRPYDRHQGKYVMMLSPSEDETLET